jgi:predicted ribosomally synthesized peptide with nif11-like leader
VALPGDADHRAALKVAGKTWEGKMNYNNAQAFVQRMREDTGFRNSIGTISDSAVLWKYIETNGFDFNECDLVKAMAACMAELENMS